MNKTVGFKDIAKLNLFFMKPNNLTSYQSSVPPAGHLVVTGKVVRSRQKKKKKN